MIKTCEICGGQYATSLDDVYTEAGCKCSEIQRENSRYREALEKIAKYGYPVYPNTKKNMAQIAAEALGAEWQQKFSDDELKRVEEYWSEHGHNT